MALPAALLARELPLPRTVHLARHDARGAFTGPACGQRDATGKGHARTLYSKNPERVTCKKCRRALDRHPPSPRGTTAP